MDNKNMLAKPVVKNKLWIVEDQAGDKIATIQKIHNGTTNVVLVTDNERTRYPSLKVLASKHNIELCNIQKDIQVSDESDVYGYPVESGPIFNAVFDVSKNLPVYTTVKKSTSFIAAGHYLIKFKNSWAKSFCPKMITLERNEYIGPFKTLEEAKNRQKLEQEK